MRVNARVREDQQYLGAPVDCHWPYVQTCVVWRCSLVVMANRAPKCVVWWLHTPKLYLAGCAISETKTKARVKSATVLPSWERSDEGNSIRLGYGFRENWLRALLFGFKFAVRWHMWMFARWSSVGCYMVCSPSRTIFINGCLSVFYTGVKLNST